LIVLAFFTITHLDTSGAFSRTLAQREPRDCPWMQYLESVLRCRVAQPPGVAQQVHKAEGLSGCSSSTKQALGPPAGCDYDLRHASRRGEGAGVFFLLLVSSLGFTAFTHTWRQGQGVRSNNSGASAFNKFLISKLAVMPIHLFPHFLELVG